MPKVVMPYRSGSILVRATLEAKKRLHQMARDDGSTGAVLLHKLVMQEWKRRQEERDAEVRVDPAARNE